MKRIKKLTAIFLCALMFLSLAACGKNEGYSFSGKEDTALAASSSGTKKSLYVSRTDKSKLSVIASSDMTELCFDKKNYTVSAYDKASGTLWSSLPTEYAGLKTSALSLQVLIDGNFYTLYSQSDSIGQDKAAFEKNENGITVIYTFEKKTEDSKKISLTVPVSYRALDGGLSVEVDCASIVSKGHDKEIALTGLSLLPYFAADRTGRAGDFILLPDGCGLTVDLSRNPESFKNISLDVYGENSQTLIGCFGMKKGDSAFVALIEQGDEIATIKTEKALADGGYNRVYPFFTLKETEKADDGVFVSEDSYKGKIKVVYRFLSSDTASYIGMAGVVRELLIRNSVLLSESVEGEQLPFNLSLVINESSADSKGRDVRENKTTFEQASEILSSMKAKGFDEINLRLEGVLKEKGSGSFAVDYSSGSAKDFEEFVSYCTNQGINLYADSNILTSEDEGKAAYQFGQTVVRDGRYCIAADKISSGVGELLSFVKDEQLNVCLTDADVLYWDYDSAQLHSQSEVADTLSQQTAAISAHKKLMLSGSFIYSVKYADMVVELPMTAVNHGKDLCTRVPFIQSVLHGVVRYSLSPVNAAENEERAFLKAVEYGAVLYYRWQGTDFSTQEKADKLYYMNGLSGAQTNYERMASAFDGLSGARITDHYLVSKGVYYTEYDNSVGIYVNYNSDAVTVNGVTVEGMSFLRVG